MLLWKAVQTHSLLADMRVAPAVLDLAEDCHRMSCTSQAAGSHGGYAALCLLKQAEEVLLQLYMVCHLNPHLLVATSL